MAGNVAEVRPELEQHCEQLELERPVFRVRLDGNAADLFFNASAGYRAAFCLSTSGGEAANRMVITLLLPRLMAYARTIEPNSASWVESSLRAPAAKAWVWEKMLHTLSFPWIHLHEEILYPVWLEAAKAWLRDKADMPQLTGMPRDRMTDRLSFWGVRAPETQWIDVKGSWLKDGAPVATLKPGRSEQIRDWGWT